MKTFAKIAATTAAAAVILAGGTAAFAADDVTGVWTGGDAYAPGNHATIEDFAGLDEGDSNAGSTVVVEPTPAATPTATPAKDTTHAEFVHGDGSGSKVYNENGGTNTFPRAEQATSGQSWTNTDKKAGSELTKDPQWIPGVHIDIIPNVNECVEVSDAELAAWGLAGASNADAKCLFTASSRAVYLDPNGNPVHVNLASGEVAKLQEAAAKLGDPAATKGTTAGTKTEVKGENKGTEVKAETKDAAKVTPAKAAPKAAAASTGLAKTGAALPAGAVVLTLLAGAGAVVASRRMK